MNKKELKFIPDPIDLDEYLKKKVLIPGRGPLTAKLWIIGEAGGEQEERKRMPFIGPSGMELAKMAQCAGLPLSECHIDNIVPFRPPQNKLANLDIDIHELYPLIARKLERFRPNCVLAAGGTALQALCGTGGVTVRRGSILSSTLVPGIKVVPMVHPAELFKDWTWRTYMIFDMARAWKEAQTRDLNLPIRTFVLRPTLQQTIEACDAIKKSQTISVDIETRRSRISCIGLGCSKDWAISIPFERRDGTSYWTEAEEAEVFRIISEILEDPGHQVIIQNHPFDYCFLRQYHLPITGQIWDTMTMHNCLWPELLHGLHILTSFYTREPYYKEDGKLWEPWMGEEILWQYNCKDVCVTFECFEALLEELKQKNLLEFYERHYRHGQGARLRNTILGFRIWENRRKRMRKRWQGLADKGTENLNLEFGKELNVYSSPDIRWLLYEHLKLPVQRDRKTGQPTTREDALEKLYLKSRNPTLLKILELRGLRKMLSSYINIDIDEDTRIRCNYGHTGFGRLKATKFLDSSGTNLLTIPEVARAFFIAD